MQTRIYAGAFATRNPDYTGVPWQTMGETSHVDTDDTTGYQSTDIAGAASLAHAMVADDEVIPSLSKVSNLVIRYRLGNDALTSQGVLAVAPYLRYEVGPPLFQNQLTPPYTVGFAEYEATFPLDPDGLPWTRSTIFRKKGKLLLFGLRTIAAELPSSVIQWSECRFIVNFALPIPLVATDPASLIFATGAHLNGRFNPMGANGTYPIKYWFEYGLTLSYGQQTIPIAGVTGTTDFIVSVPVTDLTSGKGYHFRLVVQTLDETYYGGDLFFSTHPDVLGRFRLDEFKRIPTGVWNAGDRTRMTSRGFDRPSTPSDDAACPFLEL